MIFYFIDVLCTLNIRDYDRRGKMSDKDLANVLDVEHRLRHPDHQRIFAVADALQMGYDVSAIHDLCKIDPWFLL